jgi:hypothetical protein
VGGFSCQAVVARRSTDVVSFFERKSTMARIVYNSQIPSIKGRTCLDLGDLVGQRGSNHRDDVMLVQFLLLRTLSNDPPLGPPLAMDGLYGPATHYWTLYFIVNFMTKFRHITPPNRFGGFWPLGNGDVDTFLLVLNEASLFLDKPDWVLRDRRFPPFLRQKLQQNDVGRGKGPSNIW